MTVEREEEEEIAKVPSDRNAKRGSGKCGRGTITQEAEISSNTNCSVVVKFLPPSTSTWDARRPPPQLTTPSHTQRRRATPEAPCGWEAVEEEGRGGDVCGILSVDTK